MSASRRMARLFLLLACGDACAGSATSLVAPASGILSQVGTATDPSSGRFLYGERHVVRYRDGVPLEGVVLYTCADGRPFARKLVDYSPSPVAPDFLLENEATGHREALTTRSGLRRVSYRVKRDAIEHATELTTTSAFVADAGFDEFVRGHWEALLAGDRVPIEFLVPSRLEPMRFNVEHVGSGTANGVPVEIVHLALAGFWSWLLPGIDVSYSRDERVLMTYRGLSNLRDARGDTYRAHIEFPANERRVTDSAALEEMRKAPLVHSCTDG